MGFFDRFKKQAKPELTWPVTLEANAKGQFLPMAEVPDDVFSSGVLGTCCGIDPVEGKVYAPVNGKITSLTDTMHAIGIAGEGGIDVLIHVGVDTVDMNGDGFANMVKAGDAVKKGQLLLTMDLAKIKAAGHPAVVITAVTNTDDFASVEVVGSGNVEPGAAMMKVSK